MLISILFWVFLAVSIISASMFIIWQDEEKKSNFSLILKSVASFSFIALALLSSIVASNTNNFPALLLSLALVAGAFGDVFLACVSMPFFNKEKVIMTGMVAFGIAQVFNILAVSSLSGYIWIALIFGIIVALAIFFGEKMLKLNYGKTRYVAVIYSFFLATFMGQTIVNMIFNGFSVLNLLLLLGSVLFFASDIVLSFIYFRQNANKKVLIPINLTLYYLAQILLASAIFFL